MSNVIYFSNCYIETPTWLSLDTEELDPLDPEDGWYPIDLLPWEEDTMEVGVMSVVMEAEVTKAPWLASAGILPGTRRLDNFRGT